MANIAEVLKELEQERDRLDRAIAALKPLAGVDGQPPATRTARRPGRTLSAAVRQRIATAQRARWAKIKSGKTGTATKRSRTRMVSAAARRKMAAAQRAR